MDLQHGRFSDFVESNITINYGRYVCVLCIYVYVSMCTYVYVCVCIYIYIYIHTYIHTYIFAYTCCMSDKPPEIDHGTFPNLKLTQSPCPKPPTGAGRRIKFQVVHHTTSILSIVISKQTPQNSSETSWKMAPVAKQLSGSTKPD